jgi:acyl-CoA synthetase (AMP-forming)/AMP-acid ligase II
MLQHNCERYADNTAVIDGDTTLSYLQLAHLVQQCADALHGLGIGAGDRVALWAPNSWRWIICSFACWQLGAVVVPVSSRLKAIEAGGIIAGSAARVLFTTADCASEDLPALLAQQYQENSQGLFQGLPQLEHVICLAGTTSLQVCKTVDDFLDSADGSAPLARSEDSCCEILYTSGTTGEPKGVVLNHQQVLQAFWDWTDLGGLNEQDTFLVVPPFSHGFGINAGILACVMRGMTHVVVDFFDPKTALAQLAQYQVTVMSGPPALFHTLSQAPNARRDSQSLRVVYIGAAQVPGDMITSMHEGLGIDRVINAYGLIEGCVVSMTRADDPPHVIAQTVGRPLPDIQVRILGDDGQPLPPGEIGEITVTGYNVMQGYFEAPHLTAVSIDDEGWLHTGDVGAIDDAGNITIVGRKKEMYICNGFNVYPAEVETLLARHPALNLVSVVGVDHNTKGEAGVAFIVQSPQAHASEEELLVWAKENMASYKVPLRIIPVETFPLNSNGKVRKNILKEIAIGHLG